VTNRLLTTREVAELLGVSTETVLRQRRVGPGAEAVRSRVLAADALRPAPTRRPSTGVTFLERARDGGRNVADHEPDRARPLRRIARRYTDDIDGRPDRRTGDEWLRLMEPDERAEEIFRRWKEDLDDESLELREWQRRRLRRLLESGPPYEGFDGA